MVQFLGTGWYFAFIIQHTRLNISLNFCFWGQAHTYFEVIKNGTSSAWNLLQITQCDSPNACNWCKNQANNAVEVARKPDKYPKEVRWSMARVRTKPNQILREAIVKNGIFERKIIQWWPPPKLRYEIHFCSQPQNTTFVKQWPT